MGKNTWIVFFLGFLAVGFLGAQEPSSGRSFAWESSWGSVLVIPAGLGNGDSVGPGVLAGIALAGLPETPMIWSLSGTYRAPGIRNGPSDPQLGVSAGAGWRLELGGAFSITPQVAAEVSWPILRPAQPPVGGLAAELRFEIRLWRGQSVSLGAGLQGALTQAGWPSFFQLSAVLKQARIFSLADGSRAEAGRVRDGPLQGAAWLSASPLLFAPTGEDRDEGLRIGLRVEDESAVRSWNLDILDQTGRVFVFFAGEGGPPPLLFWDGYSAEGELVSSASDYTLVLTTKDERGRTAVALQVIRTDVLVIKDGDSYKIRLPNIEFMPNSQRLLEGGSDQVKEDKNRTILFKLVEIFKKFPEYSLRIEGHANIVQWFDQILAAAEQKSVLIPLSLGRAKAVKEALVGLGIEARRIEVAGIGGARPLVPFSDVANRWKNRRVEIILLKNGRAEGAR